MAAKLQALKVGPGRVSNPGLAISIQNRRKRSLEPKVSAFFFWPPTLTVRSFATPWDTETYNTSLERSDVWLLSGYTFRGVAVLFRPATHPQSTPTLLHISAIVCNQMSLAVSTRVTHLLGQTTKTYKCRATKVRQLWQIPKSKV